MKKILYFILICLLFTGCLSWTQRAKIAKKGVQKYKEYKEKQKEQDTQNIKKTEENN